MKIVAVGSENFCVRAGGLNRYFDELTIALGGLGCAIDPVVPGNRLAQSRLPTPAKLGWRLLAGNFEAAGHLRRADLLDVHFALYGVFAVWIAKARRVPVVVHFQGPWARESEIAGRGTMLGRRLKTAIERTVYRKADRCIVLSEAFKRMLVEEYGVAANRITVIRPGVDLDRFTPGEASQAACTAVAARRLDPRMGLDTVIDAWPQVLERVPGAHLDIAGSGRERSRLEGQISRLGLSRHVRLLGRVSDSELLRLYRTATLSVVPTRYLEGFGLVALESLACGTPAVVTAVDALPEFMAELDPSLVVPPDDPAALTERLVAGFQGSLPSRADCRTFAERFSWQTAADQHISLYQNLISTGRRPPSSAPENEVVLLALEWPDRQNHGGGVARMNYRLAAQLVQGGHAVTVVTLAGAMPLPGATFKTIPKPSGRFARYYTSPLRAAKVVRGSRPSVLIATGDDWPLIGRPRSRVFTGSARSEAVTSRGARKVNHLVLAGLEYATSWDRTATMYTIGPDLPRRAMRAELFPPLQGLNPVSARGLSGEGRTGLAFIGPPGGRKRGELALQIAGVLQSAGPQFALSVYTARGEDADFWGPHASVHVGLSDDALCSALEQHAFLLSTSTYEGFGIPVVEAMAAGCVPVATRTPGAEMILTGELSQLLGPRSDADAFASFACGLISALWSDRELYQKLQSTAHRRANDLIELARASRLMRVHP